MIWAALIPAWLRRSLAWLVAGLAAFVGIWGLAKRDARRGADLDAAQDHINTTERMRDATDNLPSDDPAIRDWLRRRGAR